MSDQPRITIEGDKLAAVIKGWLRTTPECLWGSDPEYERLIKLKRHDPRAAPDPRRAVADAIVARMAELGWEMSYPEPSAPGQVPRWERK